MPSNPARPSNWERITTAWLVSLNQAHARQQPVARPSSLSTDTGPSIDLCHMLLLL
jgi:hypothetical protein